MSGAVALACLGALRAGAGLVEAAVPGKQRLAVDLTCTEVLVHGLPETEAGGLSPTALPRLLELAQRRDAVLVGPGAGADPATAGLLVELLSRLDRPAVVDADALNAFGRLQRDPRFPRVCVVTPHSGELARLLGVESAQLQVRRVELVREAAQRFGVVVLHKGAPTMVADPEGSLGVVGAGGPNLASPGTGDVLAGIVTALLAGGHPAFEAACLGAWLHGRAGDLLEPRVGIAGLIARDLLPHVASAAREAEEASR
jgi:NAD(P)H-hydrate epimerase